MFNLFRNSQEKKIETILSIAQKHVSIFQRSFIPLTSVGKGEVFLFNSCVAWGSSMDNNIINSNTTNAEFFNKTCKSYLLKIYTLPNPDLFFNLFKERFQIYRVEIGEVIKGINSSNLKFPNYFYSKLAEEHMSLGPAPVYERMIKKDEWWPYIQNFVDLTMSITQEVKKV